MRLRPWTTALLAAAATACGDATAPTREIALSFCSAILWAGIQNEGEEWRSIADRSGVVTVDASERLTVAVVVLRSFDDADLELYYLTRDQAQATFTCPASGTKRVSGSVAGVSSGSARIALGTSIASGSSFFPDFILENVPDGPLDLVAVHRNTAIVRRGVSYADGATIPLLDFASAEVFALQAHTLTIDRNGVLGPQWVTDIITRRGTETQLSYSGPPCCTDGKIYTLPANRQESGDVYHLAVGAGSGGNGRRVDRFYATPSDLTVAFGPPANTATFSAVTAPGQLWRAEIVAQPVYQSQIELVVGAPQPAQRSMNTVIRASKEYFGGTPTTWTFTVPDLSGIAEFLTGWSRATQPPTQGRVSVSGAPWLFSPSMARPGDVYYTASAF